MIIRISISAFLCCGCCYLPLAVTAEPHPHQGVVKPFASGDPNVKLNSAALTVLRSGKPYKTQIQDGTAGRGLVVQDVQAPVETVWGRILDFDKYNKMVPKTIESKIYKTENMRGGKRRIWVRMLIGFPVLKLQFFINHLYDPANNSLTWTLDYAVKSDLDDSAGYWYVIPHPDNPGQWTRVYYSVEVSMFPWVPHFVVDFMSKQALTDATAWVKKYSELEAAKTTTSTTTQWSTPGARAVPDTTCSSSRVSVRDAIRRLVHRGDQNETSCVQLAASNDATVKPIGLTRYLLVVSVLSLSLYNVHLYFSQ